MKNADAKQLRVIPSRTDGASAVNLRAVALGEFLTRLGFELKISYGSLLDLNPELQHGVTPPGKHTIRIPAALATKSAEATAEPSPVANP